MLDNRVVNRVYYHQHFKYSLFQVVADQQASWSHPEFPYQSKDGFSPQSKASCSSLTRLACPGSLNRPSSRRPHCLMKSTHCSTSMGASLFPNRRSYRTVSSSFWPKIPETWEKIKRETFSNIWGWTVPKKLNQTRRSHDGGFGRILHGFRASSSDGRILHSIREKRQLRHIKERS